MGNPSTSANSTSPTEQLITQLQQKMRALAADFARGEINRDQFHTLYERYQAQMNLATMVEEASAMPSNAGMQEGTIAIKNRLMGKAVKMAIYHHHARRIVENIGNFDVPLSVLEPIMDGILALQSAGEALAPQTHEYGSMWLLVAPGRYSSALMVFSNEPVVRQVSSVQAMHADFEVANEAILRANTPNGELALPFFSIIVKTLTTRRP